MMKENKLTFLIVMWPQLCLNQRVEEVWVEMKINNEIKSNFCHFLRPYGLLPCYNVTTCVAKEVAVRGALPSPYRSKEQLRCDPGGGKEGRATFTL